jgi:WhiB family redox-sensing transcriptional regulator
VTRMPDGPNWEASASCASADPEAWFVDNGGSTAWPKKVCSRCRVRVPCLGESIARGDEHGVFGALDPSQRRAMSETARKAAIWEGKAFIANLEENVA